MARQTSRGLFAIRIKPTITSTSLASLTAPFATLAVLGVAGLGVAGLIAPRASPDAQAALGPLVTSAILFVTSPLLLVGVAPRLLVGASPRSPQSLSRSPVIARSRRGAARLRPAVFACVAIVVFARPALRHGTWAVATTANQDPYVWVSQAHSLDHGPPKGAATTTPDRVPYDLMAHRSWPAAIPGGLAELAATTRLDPSRRLRGVLGPRRGSARARRVLWSARRASSGHSAAQRSRCRHLGNGLILLSSFYGWQAQLLLTTAATLFVLHAPRLLRSTSGIGRVPRPIVVCGRRIAVYGWTFAPFVVVAATVGWICWRHSRQRVRVSVR